MGVFHETEEVYSKQRIFGLCQATTTTKGVLKGELLC
jgi:hypothetical protein